MPPLRQVLTDIAREFTRATQQGKPVAIEDVAKSRLDKIAARIKRQRRRRNDQLPAKLRRYLQDLSNDPATTTLPPEFAAGWDEEGVRRIAGMLLTAILPEDPPPQKRQIDTLKEAFRVFFEYGQHVSALNAVTAVETNPEWAYVPDLPQRLQEQVLCETLHIKKLPRFEHYLWKVTCAIYRFPDFPASRLARILKIQDGLHIVPEKQESLQVQFDRRGRIVSPIKYDNKEYLILNDIGVVGSNWPGRSTYEDQVKKTHRAIHLVKDNPQLLHLWPRTPEDTQTILETFNTHDPIRIVALLSQAMKRQVLCGVSKRG